METWFYPLIGGILIGLATLVYLITLGKVVGISGLLAQACFSQPKGLAWLFLAGLILGGATYGVLVEPSVALPDPRSPWLLIVSGLLVGYGTRLANGCTSGHGVCGIARLAPRSILATVIFMFSAILTVAVYY